jgi:hypothetical protein
MLRNFAIAGAAAIAVFAASAPADAAARHSGIRHPFGSYSAIPHYGTSIHSGGLGASGGYAGASHGFGAGGLSGSGWRQGGFGGTLNPGVGYGFGPQLGGVGH